MHIKNFIRLNFPANSLSSCIFGLFQMADEIEAPAEEPESWVSVIFSTIFVLLCHLTFFLIKLAGNGVSFSLWLCI